MLAELRHTACRQPKSVLGVSQLDRLLEGIRYQADTTPQRPSWQFPAATSPDIHGRASGSEDEDDPVTSPRRHVEAPKPKPATTELTSPKSASGKTSLLSYLTAISVLPKELGGKASAVVYIDSDGRFSVTRLAQLMRHYIHRQSSKPATTSLSDVDMIVREALNHVHVFRPQSSSQLLSVLGNLQTYLFDPSRHSSCYRSLGMIILDSATTFSWQDRLDRAMARLETPGAKYDGPSASQRVIEHLKALQKRFECAVLFSTASSPPRSQVSSHLTTPGPEDNGRIISPWTAYAILTLTLSRASVPQFAPQMSMEECLRDREKRFDAVRKGRFIANVVSKREGETGAGGFVFRIVEEGVEIE